MLLFKLKSLLEPYLRQQRMTWLDVQPALELVDSLVQLEEALSNPKSFFKNLLRRMQVAGFQPRGGQSTGSREVKTDMRSSSTEPFDPYHKETFDPFRAMDWMENEYKVDPTVLRFIHTQFNLVCGNPDGSKEGRKVRKGDLVRRICKAAGSSTFLMDTTI